jgi:hypothetical protein
MDSTYALVIRRVWEEHMDFDEILFAFQCEFNYDADAMLNDLQWRLEISTRIDFAQDLQDDLIYDLEELVAWGCQIDDDLVAEMEARINEHLDNVRSFVIEDLRQPECVWHGAAFVIPVPHVNHHVLFAY